MPSPPQKMTTFTTFPLLTSNALLDLAVALRRGRLEMLLQPGLAAEVPVLLGPQSIGDPALGQLDVVVGEHLVLGDGSPQLAALHQALGQVRSEEHTSELQSHVNLVCR